MKNIFRLKHKIKLSSNETEFLPSALEIVEKPPSPIGRALLWIICLFIIIAVLWAIFGKVDEITVAPGKIIPTGHVKVVQSEDKGTVKKIFVKEGEKVQEGDLLLELDSTISDADVQRLQRDIGYLNLELDRLDAEKNNTLFIPKVYPGVEEKDLTFQSNLYQSRLAEYKAKTAGAEAGIQQNMAVVEEIKKTLEKTTLLYDIAKETEEKAASLVKEGAVGSFTLLDYRAKRIDLEKNLTSLMMSAERAQFALEQSKEGLRNINAERNRSIMASLVENRKRLQALSEELKKAEEKQRFSRIIAPASGRVNQLTIHTVGGVVTTAQPLMIIVPDNVSMEVEAWVANKDIGFIKPGQNAEIKIETFSFQKYGTIPAKVSRISPDAVEDKQKGLVYRATLQMGKDNIVVNGKPVYLTPGMAITAEIKIRQKRIIEYFLDPFKRYQSEALRER